MKIIISLAISLLFSLSSIVAQTNVSSLFSDHMVLQRNAQVAVWGNDNPNTKINIDASWGESASTTSDEKGNWKLTIKSKEAGGPYIVTIQGSSKVELTDVLLGEVWVCSGQSNMEMPLKGNAGQPIFGSQKAILNSTNDQLRFFKVERVISASPVDDCIGTWNSSKPETSANFSATAYFYGQMLQKQLGVPIGLICSSWGGTPAQAWTPRSVIDSDFKEFKESMVDESAYYQKTPTSLYNGMIHPLIPFTIKGAIWYQGEANKNDAKQYTRLFPAMVKAWRDNWNLGEFPFYYVQVAPLSWGGELWPLIRESQLQCMKLIPNSGMVVTLDIGEPTCIHPPYKKQVGERLAYWALAKTYGIKGIAYSGPVYKSKTIKDSKVHLAFDYAELGVTSMYRELKHFEVAGSDKVYHPAQAEIKKGKLIVWSESVKKPEHVRYGWDDYVDGCLFNTYGLPASSFRTDDWLTD